MAVGRLAVFLVVSLLVVGGWSANWMAYGNFSESNLTKIRSTIDESISLAASKVMIENEKAVYISNSLNAEWSIAWNVFTFTHANPSKSDAVVYGYAFRDHWLWFNNYNGQNITYIIWKDYNCIGWQTIGLGITQSSYYLANSSFVTAFKTKVQGLLTATPTLGNDPWKMTFDSVEWLNQQGSGQVFSGVGINDDITNYNGRFCNYNTNGSHWTFAQVSSPARFLIIVFRTR